MASTKNLFSHSEARKEEHLKLLGRLENLTLSDSCCEICHCNCYSSHRSSDLCVEGGTRISYALEDLNVSDDVNVSAMNLPNTDTNHNNGEHAIRKNAKVKKKKGASTMPTANKKTSKSAKSSPVSKSPLPDPVKKCSRKRSKSVSSIRSQSPEISSFLSKHNTRDCKILQELLSSFDFTPNLEINGKNKTKTEIRNEEHVSTSYDMIDRLLSVAAAPNNSLSPLKLCESMASLCMAPTVRKAFQQVPTHDKKILNRMATKRSEKALAKENAWLARKYWENERYERELLKCEQMEEYKRAVRDKQFQDYLHTKSRLNEIAQRDFIELRQLRESLREKDERAKRRLEAIRVERGILMCQRRCDELQKSEAVNIQQEEQHLDDTFRKEAVCHRLTERLQRAEQIRSKMLDGYLKRLRYDNYVEQLLHEENWRETQQIELAKREQLKEHIHQKRSKSQHFIEKRQRRNEVITKTAKISASLRELVRSSVTPEGALLGSNLNGIISMGTLMLDKSVPKLSIQQM